MKNQVAVVDIFSGPGGLGEGFSAFEDDSRNHPYAIQVSIEKEKSAHETLLLRSFLRKFGSEFPPEYYSFLNGEIKEPEWSEIYPVQWREAAEQTPRLELGKKETSTDRLLDQHISDIRERYGDRTLLIGGPPCQAYSLVGRARNRGVANYDPQEDERHFLYQEYVNILGRLKPAVFVMENVKGLLSSSVKGGRIFQSIVSDLRNAMGPDSARLIALSPSTNSLGLGLDSLPSEYMVRAEEHGIPQARHRVFIVGLRKDLTENLPNFLLPRLKKRSKRVAVNNVIGAMPPLRSGLSMGDSLNTWSQAVWDAFSTIDSDSQDPSETLSGAEKRRFRRILKSCLREFQCCAPTERTRCRRAKLPKTCPSDLRKWIFDDKLRRPPNHETRGHMRPDLARYLFASTFGLAFGRSPKASEFPRILAPEHKNWSSGDFSDRFRVQIGGRPATTITSHISKDGHYYIHPDPIQCRSLTVREAARLQTFPDNYLFKGNRTQQYIQVGNAVPPFLAHQIARSIWRIFQFIGESRRPVGNIRQKSRTSVKAA